MNTVTTCLREAVPATRKSLVWLLKLMIPISLSVAILQHLGVIAWFAGYLDPFFRYLSLPGASAVAFISGAAAGTYAGLAVLMSIPMTMRQATVMSVMIGICHALPMECAVNRKTGSSFWLMAAIRIIAAFVCAAYLDIVLPDMEGDFIYLGAQADSTFTDVLLTWFVSQVKVTLVMIVIIYSLMTIQRLIEAYRLLPPLSRFLSPLMTVFGLPRQSSYMWLVGNVLGISYGSAVMVELEDRGMITRDDAKAVNYHLIMNHSMLEDTMVFATSGISAFWMLSTRLLFALLLVWSKRVGQMVFGKARATEK